MAGVVPILSVGLRNYESPSKNEETKCYFGVKRVSHKETKERNKYSEVSTECSGELTRFEKKICTILLNAFPG